MIELVANGVEANMTKTSIRKENETIYIGDREIDIFENYLNMNYIMQAKYRSDEGHMLALRMLENLLRY